MHTKDLENFRLPKPDGLENCYLQLQTHLSRIVTMTDMMREESAMFKLAQWP